MDINSSNVLGSLGKFYSQKRLGVSKVEDQQPIGIGGFYFFASLSDNTELSSTSPNIVLEKGTTISDTIFNSPLKLSIKGFVADLWVNESVSHKPNKVSVSQKGQASFYGAKRNEATKARVNAIEVNPQSTLKDISNNLSNSEISQYFEGDSSGSLPEQFQAFCVSVWQAKQLVQIETQFGVYDSMHIESFKLTTDNSGKAISFTISAKQIRLAEISFSRVKNIASSFARNPSKNLNGQTASETDKGTTEGQKSEKSLLSSLLG